MVNIQEQAIFFYFKKNIHIILLYLDVYKYIMF